MLSLNIANGGAQSVGAFENHTQFGPAPAILLKGEKPRWQLFALIVLAHRDGYHQ